MSDEPSQRVVLEVSREFHSELKLAALQRGMKLKEFVQSDVEPVVRKHLKRHIVQSGRKS